MKGRRRWWWVLMIGRPSVSDSLVVIVLAKGGGALKWAEEVDIIGKECLGVEEGRGGGG